MQSHDGRRTSSQQHQLQEASQPQRSRTNELYFQSSSCFSAPASKGTVQSDRGRIAPVGACRCDLSATLKKNYMFAGWID